MKISFDFDDTLSRKSIQKYASELIERGIEVWIVTSRYDDKNLQEKFFLTSKNTDLGNKDLFEVAKELGISKERIHFTNFQDKWVFLKDKGFIWHLDDDWVENRLILKNTKIKAISCYGTPNWKGKCERIIKEI